ncbi:MAG: 2-oxoacid:acceptor oxidoreductase subunit alpha [Myxococcota bacterium]|nr:2-oxoacid:acceptor oxidoreductase subunit alpha [Myxococcota bacterium]
MVRAESGEILDQRSAPLGEASDQRREAVVRFAGDSGDGMQLAGREFTKSAGLSGADLMTFPDFPAEIRAPAGTRAGVSGFQIHFAADQVFTHGDQVDVLIAMNPAALAVNLADLAPGGLLLLNRDSFTTRNLKKAGYEEDPLEGDSLKAYRCHAISITKQTLEVLRGVGLNQRAATLCKNFYALGLVFWLFDRPLETTLTWIGTRFAKEPARLEANQRALRAGYHFGETAGLFSHQLRVPPASIAPGKYRNLSGNEALGLGLLSAAELSGLELFLASYPITPASDLLHFLSKQKALGVKSFQAEDEIAAICAAIGASYAGGLGVTSTSGPGMALKGEALGLAVMMELPLIVCNVQRGGPSTGLPTKTEQADLLQALFGRNGESPLPVIAARSPSDCFEVAIDAVRIAIQTMSPVVLLSDGSLANGAEPWRIPDIETLTPIPARFHPPGSDFMPYQRDDALARPWALPGSAGLEHRLGGLEKEELTGNVSYDPENHERMVKLRQEKVDRLARALPEAMCLEHFGPTHGEVLLISWGSTFGVCRAAALAEQGEGHAVAHLHLRLLNPLPEDLRTRLEGFRRVVVPELNLGQLTTLLRAKTLLDIRALSKVQGRPFQEGELRAAIAQERSVSERGGEA